MHELHSLAKEQLSTGGLMFPDGDFVEDTLDNAYKAVGFLSHVSGHPDFTETIACENDREGFSALLDVTSHSIRHAINQARARNVETRELIQERDKLVAGIQHEQQPYFKALTHLKERAIIQQRLFNSQYQDVSAVDIDTSMYLYETDRLLEEVEKSCVEMPVQVFEDEKDRAIKRASKIKKAIQAKQPGGKKH